MSEPLHKLALCYCTRCCRLHDDIVNASDVPSRTVKKKRVHTQICDECYVDMMPESAREQYFRWRDSILEQL